MDDDTKRLALAVILSVVHPGLGHAYLRKWVRALLWAGLFVAGVALLLPTPPTDVGPVEATRVVAESTPPAAGLAISSIVVVNALDAGLIAVTDRSTDEGHTRTCPNCGKELDDDLEFCHWCTTRVGGE